MKTLIELAYEVDVLRKAIVSDSRTAVLIEWDEENDGETLVAYCEEIDAWEPHIWYDPTSALPYCDREAFTRLARFLALIKRYNTSPYARWALSAPIWRVMEEQESDLRWAERVTIPDYSDAEAAEHPF